MANPKSDISLSALKITLIYLVVAALWIAFTDQLLDALVTDPDFLSTAQTYKGWIYVTLTSMGLLYLIKRHDRQIAEKEEKISELSEKFELEKELSDILFERIPVLINIYDPDLEEFRINKEFEKVTGWTNEEVQEINFMEACFPDLEVRREVAKFMETPGIGWKEFPLTTKSGEQLPTSWTNIKLTDDTSVGIGIDMTEIKASQAKIRKSRQLLKKTFESLKASIILIDPENRTILDCNKSTEETFGYDRDELIGNSTRMLHVDEQSYKQFDDMGRESLNKHGLFQTEYQLQKKDGTIFYSDHTVTLVYDEDGEVSRVVSVVRDITEQKKYKKQLEQRKAFIETTLENLPIGVAVNTIDDGQVSLMNEQFTNIYGWPRAILKDVDSFFEHVYQDEEYRAMIKERVMTDMQSGQPEQMEWQRIHVTTQEGEERVVNNRAIPLYDQNLMISTVVDITEQHELEEELKLQNRTLEEAQEIAQMGYWEYEIGSGDAPRWSENLYRIYGLDPNKYETTIESFLDMIHPDDKPNFDEFVEEVIEKKSINDTFRLTKPNGEVGHFHSRNQLITDSDGNPSQILGIVHDITEIKSMEEKVIQSVIEGEDRERKRIALELHDGLGQYLVAANMNFQSIEDEVGNLPEKREKQFNTGLSHLKKALSETRSIAYNLMPKAITDYGLVVALKNLIQDLQDSTDITFTFDLNCKKLNFDSRTEVNIYRIMQEIISNAVRHADCSEISVMLHKVNDSLELAVEDNGKGIQLDANHEEQGLGLRSIKTRVKSLNGSLKIQSEPGEGMKTMITIPDIYSLKQNGETE